MKNENPEELRAQQWLESQGYTDILDLSIANLDPPDFVVNNRIGVEVRRLSWMTDTNRHNQAAEELEKPLEAMISTILEEAGEPPGGYNVYLSCNLLRDTLPQAEVTKKLVGQAVDEFVDILSDALQSGKSPVHWWTQLECGLSIHFASVLTSGTGKFTLDQVEAATALRGWVDGDSIDNINRCIMDKTDKIKDIVHLCPVWWLVLVDHNVFTPGSWEDEWQTIRNGLVATNPWSRIVVLSWIHPLSHVDVI